MAESSYHAAPELKKHFTFQTPFAIIKESFYSFYMKHMKKSYIIAFWSPFSLHNIQFYTDFFSIYLRKYGNIQCLDCQNHQDPRTLRLLHQMDLVIIGLPQDPHLLTSYFCHPFEHFTNIRYAIIDYFSQGAIDVKTLCRQYRIPESQLARIPYNARYLEALRLGQSSRYLEFNGRNSSYEEIIDFQNELKRTGRLFLQALENGS